MCVCGPMFAFCCCGKFGAKTTRNMFRYRQILYRRQLIVNLIQKMDRMVTSLCIRAITFVVTGIYFSPAQNEYSTFFKITHLEEPI